MQTFSKRNKLKKEYSGYGKASLSLRNRLLLLYGHPYSGNEFEFGIGNDNWIREVALSKDLQMHFGKRIAIESFRNDTQTSYDEVFDFIELYYASGVKDLDGRKRLMLFRDIVSAFHNSGSVYEFNEDGQVILKIDDKTAENITETDKILEPFKDAQKVYRENVDGLLTRSKQPKDVVGDIYVVFEEYLKRITYQKSFEEAIKSLVLHSIFHPIQILIFNKLKAYRGDAWGAAHAGNSPEPKEEEALWYLESIVAQIRYIDVKLKQLANT